MKEKLNTIQKDFNITENELIILHLTLKNMRKGMSFEDSFKTAMETITTTWERIEYLPSKKNTAIKYMFNELYKEHGDEI